MVPGLFIYLLGLLGQLLLLTVQLCPLSLHLLPLLQIWLESAANATATYVATAVLLPLLQVWL